MYNIFELDNGLKVVIEDIEYVNSVSFGLWVANGSRNEKRYNNGISHFIEHMLFKGTKLRTSKDIAEAIENVGGQINAFTGKEATCFYTKTLYNHLELSMDVISDMLFNSRFAEEDIEREKSVVIEEINMSEDSPEDVLGDLHSLAIWGEDSISYPVLGTPDTVSSFNSRNLKEYMKKYYTPKNSVISISGRVKPHEALYLVEKYFAKWKREDSYITSYSSPKILNNIFVKNKDIEQTHVSLGLQGIALGEEELYPMALVNNIFGGGSSSRLFQRIREDMGLCYTIYSYNSSFKNTGTFNIYTGVSPKSLYSAVEAILEEIHIFCTYEFKDINLYILKEQLKGTYILGSESVSSRMFANGKSVLFFNTVRTPQDIINKIDNVTMYDVENIIVKTLKNGVLNAAFVGRNIDNSKINKII